MVKAFQGQTNPKAVIPHWFDQTKEGMGHSPLNLRVEL